MTRSFAVRSRAPRSLLAGAAFLLAPLAFGVGVADAQVAEYPPCTKKAPSPADLAAARGAHEAAAGFNDRGDYDKAIQYWRDAYNFDCTAHKILINIANAQEKKGDKAAAIVSLETYQDRAGADPAIAEKIKNLKASITTGPATGPGPGPETAPPPINGSTPPPPPVAPGERPYGSKPWILVVAGGAVVVVGAVIMPVGYSGISTAEGLCSSHMNCSTEAASQGNTGRVEVGLGWAAISVGAAAVAGGLIWQFAGNKPGAGGTGKAGPFSDVAVTPVVAPKTQGLALSGSF
jgi:hypothetical protein